MAVSEMKIISIIGLMQDLEQVSEICGRSGIFQPDNVFSFYSNTEKFEPVSSENPYDEPLKILKETVMASGRPLELADMDGFDVDSNQINEYIKYISEKIGRLVTKKKELTESLNEYENQIKKIEKFTGLEKRIDEITSCEYIKAHFGRLPKDSFYKLSIYNDDPGILFFPFTNDESYYWGLYFAQIGRADEVERAFSGLYFEEIDMSEFHGTIHEESIRFKKLCEKVKKEIKDTEDKISSFWKLQRGQCMRFYSKLRELNTYYSIRDFAARYNESFILVGWIPADEEREFCRKLSLINSVEFSTEPGSNILSHSPPVRLENKRFFKSFEFFVDTYGLPSYDEMDPTIFVSITYTILFGIMFADLGQGLLVSLAGYFMWKLKGMKLGRILIGCGISSATFGAIFGSVFGFEHVLDPIYKNIFGLHEKPVEVMASGTTDVIIYSAVGIGIFLLIVSMMLNIYSSIRRHRYGEAIFGQNGFCGLVLYISAVFILVDMMVLQSRIVNTFYILTLIILPLALIMFREILSAILEHDPDWQPESWGDYIAQSIFELFEVVLSYVTNTMSFLRVGAFVLVHAGMMMVVFTIAGMLNNVGYIIAIILGNVFVICLEALLAGIQVLRLEFYELFSRFFEGQGRPFTPVKVNDKI